MAQVRTVEIAIMRIKLVTTFIIAAFLLGCAKLEVTVDVLNPELIQPLAQDDFIQDKMQEILVEDETAVNQRFLDVQNAHFQAYVAKSDLLVQQAQDTEVEFEKKLLEISAADLITGFTEDIAPIYESREADWVATTKEVRRLYQDYDNATDAAQKSRLRKSLIVNLEGRAVMIRQLTEFVNYDLDKIEELDQNVIRRIKINVSDKSKQLFDSGGLLHSRYTYYVVKADDDEWANYYDRSFGRGTFGNTDIAIKALGPGNFTVKGLSFNPSDVATAASKVTTLAVLLAAQISGVPVNLSGTPTGVGAELAKSSSRVANAISMRDKLAASLQDQRAAMLRLARAILDEQDILENGTDEQRKQAITAIKAVYDSQVDRLSVSVPNK